MVTFIATKPRENGGRRDCTPQTAANIQPVAGFSP